MEPFFMLGEEYLEEITGEEKSQKMQVKIQLKCLKTIIIR